MDITFPSIRALTTMVSTRFNIAYDAAPSSYGPYTMKVESTGAETMYPRLDQLPGMREWLGDRVIHQLGISTFTIKNKTWESTIGIQREQMEDDQFGILAPAAGELGQRSAELPDLLIATLLNTGQTLLGNDTQYYFGPGHTNWNADASTTVYSNYVAGGGPSWFLFDTTRSLKPFVYQERRPFRLISLTNPTDFITFFENRFLWGVDGRSNAGLGMWQLAYKSNAPLTGANYAAARATMATIRRPDGAPMGITPNLLVTGPGLESIARKLIYGDYDIDSPVGSAPQSNPWKNSADYQKSPWIT